MALRRARWSGFSFIELIVVLAIIVVLIALLVPMVQLVRQVAFRAECASNLRQVGLAINVYAQSSGGEIPAVYGNALPIPRPMGWCWGVVDDHGAGAGGLLLLIARPVGMASQGILRDGTLLVCPADSAVRSFLGPDHFIAAAPSRPSFRGMSYQYCYVPQGGDSCPLWLARVTGPDQTAEDDLLPWDRGAYAGFERHNVDGPRAATTAILIERPAIRFIGHQLYPTHGAGGNVLYLDGHVAWISTIELQDTPMSYEPFKDTMAAVDQAAY